MQKILKLHICVCLLAAMFLLVPNRALANTEKVTEPVPTDAEIMSKQNSAAIISVNGVDIPTWMYDNAFRDSLKKAQKNTPENVDEKAVQREVLQNLIDMEVLYQEAKKKGFDINEAGGYLRNSIVANRYKKPGEFKRVLAKAGMTEKQYAHIWQQQASVNGLLSKEILDKITVSEEELQTRYEKDKHTYARVPKIQASHILVLVKKDATPEEKKAALEKIEGLHKRVLAGQDFAEVAKAHSEDPSAKDGGDLRFFSRQEMVKPFASAAFALKTGEISGVVETKFGYHIIKKTGEQDEIPRLEEVRNNLNTSVKNTKGQDAFAKLKAELLEKADVKIIDAQLRGVYETR